ncbi:MAG: endonuclease III domain-containing protein [Deltaproteobacteria bacterium]|nr:endonuclease III domain-containing protein [Deltaproteobacteria bacterium]
MGISEHVLGLKSKKILAEMFQRLLDRFGPQHWWPGETPFEVMVGAVLTQNTSWKNVEKALENLKREGLLSLPALLGLSDAALAEQIRPAGYFNVKTRRLKAFLEFLSARYGGDVERMRARPTERLREELLAVKGIGKETADSILLYALGHTIFVVDAYTYRVFTRHYLAPEEAGYDELQELATDHVPAEAEHYNEFHALLVSVGKEFCGPRPRCEGCPLEGLNW